MTLPRQDKLRDRIRKHKNLPTDKLRKKGFRPADTSPPPQGKYTGTVERDAKPAEAGYTRGVIAQNAQAKKELAKLTAEGGDAARITALQAQVAANTPAAKEARAARLAAGQNVFGGEGRAQGTPKTNPFPVGSKPTTTNFNGRDLGKRQPAPRPPMVGNIRDSAQRFPNDAGPRGAGRHETNTFNRPSPMAPGSKGTENVNNMPGTKRLEQIGKKFAQGVNNGSIKPKPPIRYR